MDICTLLHRFPANYLKQLEKRHLLEAILRVLPGMRLKKCHFSNCYPSRGDSFTSKWSESNYITPRDLFL